MTPEPYAVELTRTARRALAEQLPLDVAVGASDFITGPLADNPRRVGKALDRPYDGVFSARVMRDWRVLSVIDETRSTVVVRHVGHRRDSYRS